MDTADQLEQLKDEYVRHQQTVEEMIEAGRPDHEVAAYRQSYAHLPEQISRLADIVLQEHRFANTGLAEKARQTRKYMPVFYAALFFLFMGLTYGLVVYA